MSLDNIKVKYSEFEKVWNELIENKYKQQMLEYENQNSDDVVFNDIELSRVASCADAWTRNFWATVVVGLSVDDDLKIPMKTKYYLKITNSKVSLQHDALENSFTEIWDTPSHVEKKLIKALLSDIVNNYQNCFLDEFTAPAFSNLFNQGYLSVDQFSEKAKFRYYEKYGEISMLSKEARDIFIF